MADKPKKEKIALTIYYSAYDAAGKRIDVVRNGALDTHHDFDAANQVLGSVYDVAGNVISDTARSYAYDALDRLPA